MKSPEKSMTSTDKSMTSTDKSMTSPDKSMTSTDQSMTSSAKSMKSLRGAGGTVSYMSPAKMIQQMQTNLILVGPPFLIIESIVLIKMCIFTKENNIV